jgi:hypothetical protein
MTERSAALQLRCTYIAVGLEPTTRRLTGGCGKAAETHILQGNLRILALRPALATIGTHRHVLL